MEDLKITKDKLLGLAEKLKEVSAVPPGFKVPEKHLKETEMILQAVENNGLVVLFEEEHFVALLVAEAEAYKKVIEKYSEGGAGK